MSAIRPRARGGLVTAGLVLARLVACECPNDDARLTGPDTCQCTDADGVLYEVDLDNCEIPEAPTPTCPERPRALVPSPDPGSEADGAYDLGILMSQELCLAQDGDVDPVDVFRFELSEASELAVLMTSVESGCGNWFGSTACNLTVAIDANQNQLLEPDERRVGTGLTAGTGVSWYLPRSQVLYLRFDGTPGGGQFSVNFTATPVEAGGAAPAVDPPSQMDQALDLPLGTLWTEQVGTVDEADWYRFDLISGSGVDIRTPRIRGTGVAYRLVDDANGNGLPDPPEVVAGGGFREGEVVSVDLSPGTYFLELTSPSRLDAGNVYVLGVDAR